MKITVYSTTTCPYCKMLKNYLQSHSLQFEEKMIDLDEKAMDEMSGQSDGFLGVPFTLIVKDDGTKEKVVGFDQGRFGQILGIQQ